MTGLGNPRDPHPCIPAGMCMEVPALWGRARGPEPPPGAPRSTRCPQAADGPPLSHAGLLGRVTSARCRGAEQEGAHGCAGAWALSPLCRER